MEKIFTSFSSFEEADSDDDRYYAEMSVEDRIKTCFQIRDQYISMNKISIKEFSLAENRYFEVSKLIDNI